MALDKNILAQAEQLLLKHEESRRELINQIMGSVAHAAKALIFQGIITSNALRELAVFRMMEEAVGFTEQDMQEVQETIAKVRAEGREELSKHLTPEQLKAMDENLDKTLAEMSASTVTERTQ